jgi:hypothetical protein
MFDVGLGMALLEGSRHKFTPAKLLSAPLLAQKAEAS